MSEHDEQTKVIGWARGLEGYCPELRLLFAVPNGAKLPYIKGNNGKRYSPEANKLKAEGMRSGVPDLCLPVARQGFHGLFVEMKFEKNKPSEKQVEFLDALAEQGYLAAVCWGSDEAIGVIGEYLGLTQEK